jgi:hypothetical protein
MEADEMESETFRRTLVELVGTPVGSASSGPDPVNQPMIRHWAAAFEDSNPIYTDPEAASASPFGQIVAPPLMLQTWTMPTPKITGMAERGGAPTELTGEDLLSKFDAAGFVGTLASNSEFEIERYLHLGDVVSSTNELESISEQKQTRIGPGHFVTWVTTFRDGTGEVVGRQRFRILKFKPGGHER